MHDNEHRRRLEIDHLDNLEFHRRVWSSRRSDELVDDVEILPRFPRTTSDKIGLMAVVGVLATFVNPYGPNLHLWLVQSLGEARPEIRDWHPVDLTSGYGTGFLMLVGLIVVSFAGAST